MSATTQGQPMPESCPHCTSPDTTALVDGRLLCLDCEHEWWPGGRRYLTRWFMENSPLVRNYESIDSSASRLHDELIDAV